MCGAELGAPALRAPHRAEPRRSDAARQQPRQQATTVGSHEQQRARCQQPTAHGWSCLSCRSNGSSSSGGSSRPCCRGPLVAQQPAAPPMRCRARRVVQAAGLATGSCERRRSGPHGHREHRRPTGGAGGGGTAGGGGFGDGDRRRQVWCFVALRQCAAGKRARAVFRPSKFDLRGTRGLFKRRLSQSESVSSQAIPSQQTNAWKGAPPSLLSLDRPRALCLGCRGRFVGQPPRAMARTKQKPSVWGLRGPKTGPHQTTLCRGLPGDGLPGLRTAAHGRAHIRIMVAPSPQTPLSKGKKKAPLQRTPTRGSPGRRTIDAEPSEWRRRRPSRTARTARDLPNGWPSHMPSGVGRARTRQAPGWRWPGAGSGGGRAGSSGVALGPTVPAAPPRRETAL